MKKKFFQAAFLVLNALLFSQGGGKVSPLHYYGVVTNVDDQNMLNITQDLFAAQLRTIAFVSFLDKRLDAVKKSYDAVSSDEDGTQFFSLAEKNSFGKDAILFYARIFRPQSDEKWECTFFAKNVQTQKIASKTKSFDSYYKILSDAKMLIQNVVAEAAGKINSQAAEAELVLGEMPRELDAENLAGTWSGEAEVSKIILMRSGRGFVVFSNGATMNTSVSVVQSERGPLLRVVQRDKFNASYYPDIDRKEVLAHSQTAKPIEWNLKMTSKGTLEGTKKTLAKTQGGVEAASVSVVWKKK